MAGCSCGNKSTFNNTGDGSNLPLLDCDCPTCGGCSSYSVNSNCQTIHNINYSVSFKTGTSFNVPRCGEEAILFVPIGTKLVSEGYIWNPTFGYFQVLGYDQTTGRLTIVNPCLDSVAIPGLQIPTCTEFISVGSPLPPGTVGGIFLLSNFTAPAVGECVTVTLTSVIGLAPGINVSIGNAIYFISDIQPDTNAVICNEGAGFAPGTPIIAVSSFGQLLYPVSAAANSPLVLSVSNVNADPIDLEDVTGTTAITATSFSITNPSPSSSLLVFGNVSALITGALRLGPGPPTMWAAQYQLQLIGTPSGYLVDVNRIETDTVSFLDTSNFTNFFGKSIVQNFSIILPPSFSLDLVASITIIRDPIIGSPSAARVDTLYVNTSLLGVPV